MPATAYLEAADPAAWLSTHLAARYAEDDDGDGTELRVVTLAELTAGDAEPLRAVHARVVAVGTPAPVAATYLAGWYGGALAGVVGFGLVAGDCGFLVDSETLRFQVHPYGWPAMVDVLPPRAVVAADHPWARLDGVEVGDPDGRAVAALVGACTPIVDACRSLATVGGAGLWNEIGDALGSALAFQFLVPPTDESVARLAAAVDQPGVPWKTRPRLAFARSGVLGRVHVAQKGGCCLAYTCPDAEAADPYCMTCSFRDPAACDAKQVAWLEQTHTERSQPSTPELEGEMRAGAAARPRTQGCASSE